jgi:hypothetical protein
MDPYSTLVAMAAVGTSPMPVFFALIIFSITAGGKEARGDFPWHPQTQFFMQEYPGGAGKRI